MALKGMHRPETTAEIIERLSIPIPECGCYAWLGAYSRGYAKMDYYEGDLRKRARVARFLCEPVPDGLEVDHLCRQRWCVNPDHLELVTHKENVRRAWESVEINPFCPAHPTIKRKPVGKRGQLICRICQRENLRRWRAKQRTT